MPAEYISPSQLMAWAATHPGAVRTRNEDSMVNRPDLGLWAVADGAGGHTSGDVASRMAAEALNAIPIGLSSGSLLTEIRRRLSETHAALLTVVEGEPSSLCATTVVILVVRDGHFACLWAGDSRAYLLRGGELSQINRDHSLVQEMVDKGELAADQAESHPYANVITRAVGAGEGAGASRARARGGPGRRAQGRARG